MCLSPVLLRPYSMHRYTELMDQPYPDPVCRMHLGFLCVSKTQCTSCVTDKFDGVLSHPQRFHSCCGLPHLNDMCWMAE